MSRTIHVKDILSKSITSDGKAVMPIDVTRKTLGELSSDDLVAAIYQAKEAVQAGVVVDYLGPPPISIIEIHIEEDEEE